jgi:hypothetical protein
MSSVLNWISWTPPPPEKIPGYATDKIHLKWASSWQNSWHIIQASIEKSCSKPVYKTVWHIPLLNVQWVNFWWRTEELPETCRVSCRSKFGKLVHLVGFIIKKFVTMHGHMNVEVRIVFFPLSLLAPQPKWEEASCRRLRDHTKTHRTQ